MIDPVPGVPLAIALVGMLVWEWAHLRRRRPPRRDPYPLREGPPLSVPELLAAIEGHEAGHVVVRVADGRQLEGWVWVEDESSEFLTFRHAPSPFYAQATGTDQMAPPDEEIRVRDVVAWLDDERRWRPIRDP